MHSIARAAITVFLIALPAAAAGQDVGLSSPRDYQIFQRRTRASGEVLVSGRASVDCDRVEAKLTGGWVRLRFDRQAKTFQAGLPAAAGGFYPLAVRLLLRGKTVAETSVPHVGVGEIFVVAGQSNATNYGEVRQQTISGMVVTFDGDNWRLANDPQPGVQDSSSSGSFIPPFGDALYEKYRVPIGVACVGYGSTSVRQWLPKGERMTAEPTMTRFVVPAGPGAWESTGQLFDGMVRRIRQLGDHGFRALLWHQGESDAHQQPQHDITAAEYRRMMELVIRASRREAGWDFPWMVAQASYHTPDDASCPPIREAQQSLWTAGIALEGPDTDQLKSEYRQNGGRGVHFSDKGLQAHGTLWADEVSAWLDSVLR
jgi:hypothetical protein